MKVDVKVDGLKELEQQLKKLGIQVQEDTLNKALMNASLPAFKAAKNRAPGSIKKAIRRRRHLSKKSRRISVKGTATSLGKSVAGVSIILVKKSAPHGHLLELGTKQRQTKGKSKADSRKGRSKRYKSGANRGKVEPMHFMTDGWNAHGKEKSIDRFKLFLKRRVDKLTK